MPGRKVLNRSRKKMNSRKNRKSVRRYKRKSTKLHGGVLNSIKEKMENRSMIKEQKRANRSMRKEQKMRKKKEKIKKNPII